MRSCLFEMGNGDGGEEVRAPGSENLRSDLEERVVGKSDNGRVQLVN